MKFAEPISLSVLATRLGLSFRGNPDLKVTGINEIHRVVPGEVTFVDVEKYYRKALESPASVVIIDQEVPVPEGKGLLISDAPFQSFNQLGDMTRPAPQVARSAEPRLAEGVMVGNHVAFGEDVAVGSGTLIGHNVSIGSHVRIGANCVIYPGVYISDYTEIGDHVCINANTVVGGEAFYFKSYPDRKEKFITRGRVIIHDHVDIGSNCSIDRGVTADTVIGAYTKIDNLVQIGHDTQIGARCLLAGQTGIAGVSTIEDDVILLGKVGVVKDVTIGKRAVIQSASNVGKSLKGGQTYLGWMAQESTKTMREVVASRKLPELLRRLEGLLGKKEV